VGRRSAGGGADVEEAVGAEAQLLQSLGVLLVESSGRVVGHQLEAPILGEPLHPAVDISNGIVLLKMEYKDISFLISDLKSAYLLLTDKLLIQLLLGWGLDHHGSLYLQVELGLLVLICLGDGLVFTELVLGVELLLYLPSDVEYFAVLYHLLWELPQKLLFGLRLELILCIGVEVCYLFALL